MGLNLKFNQFHLKHRKIIQSFIDEFQPCSCEYNFSNLFSWQYVSKLSWSLYHKRLLIYDNIRKCTLFPLGREFNLEKLVDLSLHLKNSGLNPDVSLVPSGYIKKFPEIKKYYKIEKERDNAEYIYDVKKLVNLAGKKLHKKRNLISQFKKKYLDFKIFSFKKKHRQKAIRLTEQLMTRSSKPSQSIIQEYGALTTALNYFDALGLEGLSIIVNNKLIAFCIFSRLNDLTYDIQFEKADLNFKGAAQIINYETAKYLKNNCSYLNKEQDLGIKGLRQAKMSYDPLNLMIPYKLYFYQ